MDEREYYTSEEIDARIDELHENIKKWDELAKDNENNKHNLSTSERQDWIDELNDLCYIKTL